MKQRKEKGSGWLNIFALFLIVMTLWSVTNKKEKEIPKSNAIIQENIENFESTNLSNVENISNDISVDEITDLDFKNLVLLVICEAGSEPREGQVAVVATVLNRVNSPRFGGNISDVIFAPGQFSCVWDDVFHLGSQEIHYSQLSDFGIDVVPIEEAVNAALNGEDPTEDQLGEDGALYYYNPDYTCSSESDLRATISNKQKIGNHVFYRIWD